MTDDFCLGSRAKVKVHDPVALQVDQYNMYFVTDVCWETLLNEFIGAMYGLKFLCYFV